MDGVELGPQIGSSLKVPISTPSNGLTEKIMVRSVVKTRIRVSDEPESKTFHGERSDLGM